MIAKSNKKRQRLALIITVVGLAWIAFLIWLAFHNWQAAVFICLLQIALNTGGTKNQVEKLSKSRYF